MNYPWLDLYDEYLPAIEPNGGFKHVRTVDQLDGVTSSPSLNAVPLVTASPSMSDSEDSTFSKPTSQSSNYWSFRQTFRRILKGNASQVSVPSSGTLNNIPVSTPAQQSSAVSTSSIAPSPGSSIINPDQPPQCTAHPNLKAAIVLRPCSHLACDLCLGKILLGGSRCTQCGATVVKYVGFKKPVPNVSADDHSGGEWVIEETDNREMAEEDGAKVVTRVLEHDWVAPLRGPLAMRTRPSR